MKKFTIEDIRKLRPCYDPSRHLPENWTGTVVDILEVDGCPAQDCLWVALRLLENRLILETFAIDCAFAAYAYAYAADAAYAAAADTAAYAAAAYAAAAYAADAYAAAAYAAAAYAADTAAYAAVAVADAADADADVYADVYAYAVAAERERQIDALIYLLRGPK